MRISITMATVSLLASRLLLGCATHERVYYQAEPAYYQYPDGGYYGPHDHDEHWDHEHHDDHHHDDHD